MNLQDHFTDKKIAKLDGAENFRKKIVIVLWILVVFAAAAASVKWYKAYSHAESLGLGDCGLKVEPGDLDMERMYGIGEVWNVIGQNERYHAAESQTWALVMFLLLLLFCKKVRFVLLPKHEDLPKVQKEGQDAGDSQTPQTRQD